MTPDRNAEVAAAFDQAFQLIAGISDHDLQQWSEARGVDPAAARDAWASAHTLLLHTFVFPELKFLEARIQADGLIGRAASTPRPAPRPISTADLAALQAARDHLDALLQRKKG
ncbi:MAG: hypothetical protein QM702_25220 [Rubrivivax sp.]